MAEHHFGSHSAAAVVFFILYLAVTIPVTYLLFTKRVSWRGRWLILSIHCLLRLASQGVAIAFGIVSYDNTDLLSACSRCSIAAVLTSMKQLHILCWASRATSRSCWSARMHCESPRWRHPSPPLTGGLAAGSTGRSPSLCVPM